MTVNLIDQPGYQTLCKKAAVSLQPDTTKIYVYGANTPMDIAGKFDTMIGILNQSTEALFHLTRVKSDCLIGYPTVVVL